MAVEPMDRIGTPEPELVAHGDERPVERASGPVKWFDSTRGFGFAVTDIGDVLIHFSLLRDHQRRTLPDGTQVVLDVVTTERGWQAVAVVSIDLSTASGPDADARTAERDLRPDSR